MVVAVSTLTMAPSGQAQSPDTPIDQECSPNPIQVGEHLTCTIGVVDPFATGSKYSTSQIPSRLA